jgi:hypothetical protein
MVGRLNAASATIRVENVSIAVCSRARLRLNADRVATLTPVLAPSAVTARSIQSRRMQNRIAPRYLRVIA